MMAKNSGLLSFPISDLGAQLYATESDSRGEPVLVEDESSRFVSKLNSTEQQTTFISKSKTEKTWKFIRGVRN